MLILSDPFIECGALIEVRLILIGTPTLIRLKRLSQNIRLLALTECTQIFQINIENFKLACLGPRRLGLVLGLPIGCALPLRAMKAGVMIDRVPLVATTTTFLVTRLKILSLGLILICLDLVDRLHDEMLVVEVVLCAPV